MAEVEGTKRIDGAPVAQISDSPTVSLVLTARLNTSVPTPYEGTMAQKGDAK